MVIFLVIATPYMAVWTGSGADYINATRDSEGNYAFIYLPGETRSAFIHADQLAGTVNAMIRVLFPKSLTDLFQ